MLGIAIQFGVSLVALEAANPTASARFLSIGTVLVIPLSAGGPAAVNLAPPPLAPVEVGQPACYSLPTNALYCFVEARNPGTTPLENVSARIILADGQGLPLASMVAYAALDLIPPGKAVPLVALFQPAPAAVVAAVGLDLLTANLAGTPASVGSAVPLDVASDHGGPLGARWTVTGQVRNLSNEAVSTGWVVLALYDAHGQIVGYRKHVLAAGLPAGAAADFSIVADTLGGAVDHYALLAEGRP